MKLRWYQNPIFVHGSYTRGLKGECSGTPEKFRKIHSSRILKETKKAWYIKKLNGEGVWVPKGIYRFEYDVKGNLLLADWVVCQFDLKYLSPTTFTPKYILRKKESL